MMKTKKNMGRGNGELIADSYVVDFRATHVQTNNLPYSFFRCNMFFATF